MNETTGLHFEGDLKSDDPGPWGWTAECGASATGLEFAAAKTGLFGHVVAQHSKELEAATEFMQYARAHYNDGGWDVIVETMELAEIAETFAAENIRTLDEALAKSVLMACVSVWSDRQADARNSAF